MGLSSIKVFEKWTKIVLVFLVSLVTTLFSVFFKQHCFFNAMVTEHFFPIVLQVEFVLFTIVLFFVYGIYRITDDFRFTHRRRIQSFIRVTWFIIPIGSIFFVSNNIYNWYILKPQSLSNTAVVPADQFVLSYYLLPAIVLLFILLIGVLQTVMFTMKKNTFGVFLPQMTWGPYSKTKKLERRKFKPKSKLRYEEGSGTRCSHICLKNNATLEREVEAVQVMLDEYYETIGEILEEDLADNVRSQCVKIINEMRKYNFIK